MATHPWRSGSSQMGRIRHAATELGISFESYVQHLEDRENWCSFHKTWEPEERFGANQARWNGLQHACRDGINQRSRERNVQKKVAVS